MHILDFGMIPNHDYLAGIPARVTAVHKERYQIICDHGETYARLKTREYYVDGEAFPTVGDFVMVDYIPNGDSRILSTLPRRTYFSRRDPDKGRGEQAVAAKLTEAQVKMMRELYVKGHSQKEIADAFSISRRIL